MAVVDYRVGRYHLGSRHFEVPKRAGELKYWYKAARRALPALPEWAPWMQKCADITVESIIIDWTDEVGQRHVVAVARKRQLI